MDLNEERDTIERCRRDPTAFGRIYEAHFGRVFAYVLHRVGAVAVAEDLTAQTFLRAMEKLWQFKWRGISIANWLFRLATNEANAHFRRLRRRERGLADAAIESLRSPAAELDRAQAEVDKCRLFRKLNDEIAALRPADQALLVLRYFEKKSYKDMAAILGKREGTLRMRTKRALDRLRDNLAARGVTDERFREAFAEHGPAIAASAGLPPDA